MNGPAVLSAAEYLNLKDLDCGFSRWVTIDQDRIDKFADATEDHQFIHVDPSRAAGTPFGGTIAHAPLSCRFLWASRRKFCRPWKI